MTNMFRSTLRGLFVATILFFFITGNIHAAAINGANRYSNFVDGYGQVNWLTTNGDTVDVDEPEITGEIWGENVGWIRLTSTTANTYHTTTFTCQDDGTADVGGFAFGENTGWINFDTTNQGPVVVDTDGYFDGYAWVQNYGWMEFDSTTCPGGISCLQTTNSCEIVDPPDCEDDNSCGTESIPVRCTLFTATPSSGPGDTVTLTWNSNIASGNLTGGELWADTSQLLYELQPGNEDYSVNVAPSVTTQYAIYGLEGNFLTGTDTCGPITVVVPGTNVCENPNATNYGGPLPCLYDNICEDPDADNYGGPLPCEYGPNLCSDPVAINTGDPLPCLYENICLDTDATNYGGSLPCQYNNICEDPDADNYGGFLPCLYDNDKGCTDPEALNYDDTPGLSHDPDSCVYPTDDPVCEDPDALNIGEALPCEYPSESRIPFGAGLIALIALIGSWIGNPAIRFGNLILSIFAHYKRSPWGIVYDSKTKKPLDPAYVLVYDENGQVVADAITDYNGRYGFLLDPGTYTIEASKTNYLFPSEILRGRKSDDVYDGLYFGEPFTVEKREEITTLNIPMDPTGEDWNQKAKGRYAGFLTRMRIARAVEQVVKILFPVGFVLTIVITIMYPHWWNYLMLALYIVTLLLMLFAHRNKSFGNVRINGKSAVGHTINVVNTETNMVVGRKRTNDKGRYYMLVAKGTYMLVITNPQGAEVYRTKPFKTFRGVINRNIRIKI